MAQARSASSVVWRLAIRFQLGLKYSEALDLKVLNQNGKTVPVWMGCYGIGVSRVLACIAETHHDDKGLAWPMNIAPAGCM